MDYLIDHWTLIVGVFLALVLLVGYRFVLWLFGVIVVPDDSIGVVTKKFVLFGKNQRLPDGRIVALNGEAEASKTRAVGSAEAEVVKLKIASMESGNYAMVQVAEALSKSGVKLVPDVVAGGGAGGGTLVDVLLANVIRDNSLRMAPKL